MICNYIYSTNIESVLLFFLYGLSFVYKSFLGEDLYEVCDGRNFMEGLNPRDSAAK